jgi:putative hydrolases of HD superfamily
MATTEFNALLRLADAAGDLKVLPRTGWLFAGVAGPESLADHTCGVALFTLFLSGQINADPVAQGLQEPLDVERAVSMALIHDLAESILTDLPRRSVAFLGGETKHKAEREVNRKLFADLPGGDHYHRLWEEYQAASTPEARLVKDVDKLEMVAQALRYADRGHHNLEEFWHGHRWHYAISGELYTAFLSRRSQSGSHQPENA